MTFKEKQAAVRALMTAHSKDDIKHAVYAALLVGMAWAQDSSTISIEAIKNLVEGPTA